MARQMKMAGPTRCAFIRVKVQTVVNTSYIYIIYIYTLVTYWSLCVYTRSELCIGWTQGASSHSNEANVWFTSNTFLCFFSQDPYKRCEQYKKNITYQCPCTENLSQKYKQVDRHKYNTCPAAAQPPHATPPTVLCAQAAFSQGPFTL